VSASRIWQRVIKRALMLVLLGWILCWFRDQFADALYKHSLQFSLGMDVLQLLGISYLVARVGYEVSAVSRTIFSVLLLVGYWALLRFYPQGDIPRGTFTESLNAIGYIYKSWPMWDATTLHLGLATVGWRGLMSVPPAAATMLLGTLIGDWLRRDDIVPSIRAKRLAVAGVFAMLVGFVWAFDLPFNKPRWTPSYLVYVAGVDAVLLALLYWFIDIKNYRRWTYPLLVFGMNAIAVYWLSIMFKILVLNTPRIGDVRVIDFLLTHLKTSLGNWAGGWVFTICFVGFWWLVMDQLYRRKIFWKL
jgi:predicted acyltransferase